MEGWDRFSTSVGIIISAWLPPLRLLLAADSQTPHWRHLTVRSIPNATASQSSIGPRYRPWPSAKLPHEPGLCPRRRSDCLNHQTQNTSAVGLATGKTALPRASSLCAEAKAMAPPLILLKISAIIRRPRNMAGPGWPWLCAWPCLVRAAGLGATPLFRLMKSLDKCLVLPLLHHDLLSLISHGSSQPASASSFSHPRQPMSSSPAPRGHVCQ